MTDPFALEVHTPVQPDDPPPGLPELPAYVPREHDTELSQVVRAAAAGHSGIAVLVGGSSTGKTRACWEALQILRDQPEPWRMWHPIDPTYPDAALRELPGIGPRTVVWLNDAQLYLDVADGGLGERVAAGLRELLREQARGPVLVLATLWPRFWGILTAHPTEGPDPHPQARELLAGHQITVPAAFTQAQFARLAQTGDPRLALAAAGAQDGQVIQFLAGAPELLDRYHNAPPAAAALINAAMDARRLGMRVGLPEALLEAAAPEYLTDADWDALAGSWKKVLKKAWDYASEPCKGASGPLTPIHPRPTPGRATGPGSPDPENQPSTEQASTASGPLYRLADYLDQYGRAHRQDQIPPAGFWAAAVAHAATSDQAALGDAADDRGLYHAAAQLHKNAAASGSLRLTDYFWRLPSYLRDDARSASWAAAHAPLDDPDAVADLLESLRQAGAQDQVAALLARDPVGHASLDNPAGVAYLLDKLRVAGALNQVATLADRAAAHAALDDPEVAFLLKRLGQVDAPEQAAALATRAAAHISLDDPRAVAEFLRALREAGAHDQTAALLARDPAAHAALDDPFGVALLLRALREAGAPEQEAALADRAAAHVPLDNLRNVAFLLQSLRPEQAATLLARDPAALDDPVRVAYFLRLLREEGATQQADALLARDPAAHAPLDNPGGVARLLDSLREAGAQDQADALLARDPAAHVPLDDPRGVAILLDALREAGAPEQADALADRAAARAPLDDPDTVGVLLRALREAGAQEQADALLARDPAAHAALDDPSGVEVLLDALQKAGAQDQATALAERLPAAGMFGLFLEQAGREDPFRFGREADGSPSAPWGWGDLDL